MTIDSSLPLLDLFKLLRSPLRLTIEQYYLLLSALGAGFGWSDWGELKRICKLVWVKTNVDSEPHLIATFDRLFDLWQI
jgi:uncharacterized protein